MCTISFVNRIYFTLDLTTNSGQKLKIL